MAARRALAASAETMTDSPTFPRSAGVLLHPTSLPGGHGIGDLGTGAFDFVDWLAAAGVGVWQVLPMGPTDDNGSPYAGWSVFAGNPLMIAIEPLWRAGLLRAAEVRDAPATTDRVDFPAVTAWKGRLLDTAARRFLVADGHRWRADYDAFIKRSGWLADAGLFATLREEHDGSPWWTWPATNRDRRGGALARARRRLSDRLARFNVTQFFFDRQWQSLRRYAKSRGVRLFGDLPIYTALDSADVWAHRRLFQLGEDGRPLAVSGVPPDGFSETGQLWGNPLYHWPNNAKRGYRWWVARMQRTFELFDLVRMDHFRGFAAYWRVPADAEDAIGGNWQRGPGMGLFRAVFKALGPLAIVAEDLGIIDAPVHKLLDATGMPGMRVLQFAFGGDSDDQHLPHNHPQHSVVYTGTHDNNTVLGWWLGADEHCKHHVRLYLAVNGHDIVWDLIRCAMASPAHTAIVPAQDVLCLGTAGRMNTPAVTKGNWAWRLRDGDLASHHAHRMRQLIALYARLPARSHK